MKSIILSVEAKVLLTAATRQAENKLSSAEYLLFSLGKKNRLKSGAFMCNARLKQILHYKKE